jgi:hypothetical protein
MRTVAIWIAAFALAAQTTIAAPCPEDSKPGIPKPEEFAAMERQYQENMWKAIRDSPTCTRDTTFVRRSW